jgi:uncharacterized protein YraI
LEAEVTSDLNMRAGPGARFPIITTIPEGRTVEVYGCLNDYEWCDVSWRGNRGWVFTDYLDYYYRNQPRPVMEWGPRIGIPVITFSFGDYARRHYRNMPWYSDRERWYRWDRDRRDHRRDYGDDNGDDNVRYYRDRDRSYRNDYNDGDGATRTYRRYQNEDDTRNRVDNNDGTRDRNSTASDNDRNDNENDNANMRRMPHRGMMNNDETPGNSPIRRCNPAREDCTPGRSQTQGNSTTSDENDAPDTND